MWQFCFACLQSCVFVSQAVSAEIARNNKRFSHRRIIGLNKFCCDIGLFYYVPSLLKIDPDIAFVLGRILACIYSRYEMPLAEVFSVCFLL